MKNMSPAVVDAVLAVLNEADKDEARTEIIRVRVRPEEKAGFAKCSAALGLPSATHAYKLMMDAMHAHVRRRPSERTGASRRPVVRGAMNPRRL